MKVDHSTLTFFSSGTPGGSRRLQYAVIALSLLVFLALLFYAREGRSTYDRDGAGITYETARVLAVLADNTEADPSAENVLRGSQDLELLDPPRFMKLLRAFGVQRVLFGSDSPWSGQKQSLEWLRALPLSQGEQRALLGGTAERLLGLG